MKLTALQFDNILANPFMPLAPNMPTPSDDTNDDESGEDEGGDDEGGGGGGGGGDDPSPEPTPEPTPSGGGSDIPQPLIVSMQDAGTRPKAVPMFKNMAAAQGYVAMHLFINSNMDPQNGIAGKTAAQAAADAAARSGAIIGAAGGMIHELCEE